jgi:hypothetical protein
MVIAASALPAAGKNMSRKRARDANKESRLLMFLKEFNI